MFQTLVPPKIERKHLKDITVSAGEMLKFEGNIIGEPPGKNFIKNFFILTCKSA
jgi:hypothetical protein